MGDLILFDIDGTLFDPRKFGILYRSDLMKTLSIKEDTLAAAIADYYATIETSTDFDPTGLISFIAQRFGAERPTVEKIFWDKKHFEEAIFEDAKPAVSQLSKSKTLGIYSQGFPEYQRHKLEATDLLKYFNPNYIFIHRRKSSDEALAAVPRNATIIEDKHDVVEALAPICPVIWLNRRTPDSDPQIRTIHSLSELTTNN